jgi:hypothetical protein
MTTVGEMSKDEAIRAQVAVSFLAGRATDLRKAFFQYRTFVNPSVHLAGAELYVVKALNALATYGDLIDAQIEGFATVEPAKIVIGVSGGVADVESAEGAALDVEVEIRDYDNCNVWPLDDDLDGIAAYGPYPDWCPDRSNVEEVTPA